MLKLWRRTIQNIIILIVRPYVIRELPGWGKVRNLIEWDWLWTDAPVKTIREKMYGNLMQLNLSKWSDRSDYFLGRWYDLEMQLLINNLVKSGETVVDVGAHRGEFALAASRVVGSSGMVICFEPNPNSIKFLKDEIELNKISNITVHPCGLADQDDILTLTVDDGIGHLGNVPYKEDNLMFSVPVRRGDDVLDNKNPSLIKIDVEGFETKVVLGLFKTIERCSPVVITEVDASLLKEARSSVEELKNAMERLWLQRLQTRFKKEWLALRLVPR